ncbi:MAG: hypothetical protein ACOYMG_04465 [Candidatus Methylumidiphilus sp.]
MSQSAGGQPVLSGSPCRIEDLYPLTTAVANLPRKLEDTYFAAGSEAYSTDAPRKMIDGLARFIGEPFTHRDELGSVQAWISATQGWT